MKNLFLLALLATPLAACSSAPVPCPICYEDEWSRTPFPGEQTQDIPTPDPKIKTSHETNPANIPN